MSRNQRLLYLNTNPANHMQVTVILDRAGVDCIIKNSLDIVLSELSWGGYSIILIDGLPQGKLSKLQEISLPIISIVDKKEENSAVDALEQGEIADYVLITKAELKRLPLVVRAVLARGTRDQIQQDAIYQIAQASLETESLDALFASIHMIISEVMPAKNFYIALYDASTNLIDFPYYHDDFDEPPPEPAQLDKGLTAYVVQSRKSLLVNKKIFEEMRAQGKVSLVGTAFCAWLGVPLFIGNQVIGIMGVQHYEDENAYCEGDQRFLEFVSSQIASTIYRKQTEVELRENELRFRSLFENATIGIYRSTPDGKLLLVNPTLLRISGYDSFDELRATDLNKSGYVYPEERERFQALLERDREVHDLEATWRKKDGSAIYVRESARLVQNDETGEIYYEGIVEDITERKKAELALKEKVVAFETLAEIDAEILLTNDSTSLLKLVCRRAIDLLKASKSCIVSVEDKKSTLLALYGFQNTDTVEKEFSEDSNLKAFNRRESYSIRDLSKKNFPLLMPKTRAQENIRSIIAESFATGRNFRAVFVVFDELPRTWTDEDQQLLKFLAGQVALSLEKTRLLQDAEQRAKNFETLYSLGREVASKQDFEDVLNLIVKSVLRMLSTASCFVYIYDETNAKLHLKIIKGVELNVDLVLDIGDGISGKVAKSRKPKRIKNYRTWRGRLHELDGYSFSAIMAVPMIYGGQLIGVLVVSEIGNTSREFSDDEMRLLSLFAGQAASAVFNARLFTQIQKRNEELDRLHRALGMLIGEVSANRYDLCQGICDIIVSEFNHTSCSIWLYDKSSPVLEQCGASGAYTGNVKKLTIDGKGLIPKAIRENILLNVGDVHNDSNYLEGWHAAVSELVIPLVVEEKIIGVIDLQHTKPYAFNHNDERLISVFANRAALMLDHVRLVEQMEERNRRLDTLHAIEISLAASLDLRITLNALVEQLQSRLDVDAASVHIFDEDVQMLENIASSGLKQAGLGRHRIRIGENIVGQVALDQEIVYLPDLTRPEVASQFPENIAAESFVSAIVLPLVAKGQLYGVLEMYYRRQVQTDPTWLGFVETLARQVAVAIDGIQVFDQLQQALMEHQVAQDATIESWSHLLEMRGMEPEGHGQRVTAATLQLAQQMGIDDSKLTDIYRGSLLHDIGKLLLPDSITHKSGSLSDAEWQLIYQHPVNAKHLLSKIAPFRSALSIPYCHHENWDGSGYPQELQGKQIPVEARIFRVVETWDLMSVDLPYRRAISKKDVLDYIKSQAEKRFDPQVVEKFLVMMKTRIS